MGNGVQKLCRSFCLPQIYIAVIDAEPLQIEQFTDQFELIAGPNSEML